MARFDYYAVALFAGLLIASDAVLTVVAVSNGLAVEVNPLLNWTEKLELLLAFKTWLSVIGLTFLATIANDKVTISEYPGGGTIAYYPARLVRLARTGLWAILGVYLLVNIYHVIGRIVWA